MVSRGLKLAALSCSLLLLASRSAFADTSSTNYRMESEHFAGGGSLSLTSTNYKMEEGTIDWTTKENLTSTGYKVEGKVGIKGTGALPTIQSVSPGDFTRFYTDQSASFTVTASSPDGDALQYQAKQDGTTKAGPQASGALSWALGASDKGRHTLMFQVIDPDGAVSQTQSDYVFRRPVK